MAACLALGALAAALSAMLVRRMIRLGVMDVPGARSAHARPTPKGGGVGPVAALLLGTPVLLALLPGSRGRVAAAGALLTAVLLLAAVSWLDDLRQFGYRAKLGAQLGAALLAVLAAALAAGPALPRGPVLALVLPAGVAWLLLATNATNFIDGLNGLASGSALVACLAGAWLGRSLGDPLPFALGLTAACGLAGFLPFNYPRARIFLGDVGSQPVGLLMGTLALLALADGDARGALLVPLMLAGILWDVVLTLGRRAVAGRRLAEAHRDHLYQRAARAGVPAPAVAALHWGFTSWGLLVWLAVLHRPSSAPVWTVLLAAALAALPQVAWTIRAWR